MRLTDIRKGNPHRSNPPGLLDDLRAIREKLDEPVAYPSGMTVEDAVDAFKDVLDALLDGYANDG